MSKHRYVFVATSVRCCRNIGTSKHWYGTARPLSSITQTVYKNKLNLCCRLLRNDTTRTILLHLLTTINNDFVDDLVENGVDILDLILSGRRPVIEEDEDPFPEDVRVVLETCVENWASLEARLIFWGIMEEHVPVN